jgi:hypothetical protein
MREQATLYFCDSSRTERYFVSTLLCHVLMANDFSRLKILFQSVFGKKYIPGNSTQNDEFEVVTELNAHRDLSRECDDIKSICKGINKIAVPDIFLRWSNLCLIIEAKFFTNPSSTNLHNQVARQRNILDNIKKYTAYKNCEFKYATLTLKEEVSYGTGPCSLSWSKVIDLIDCNSDTSKDIAYSISMLRNAINRAQKETEVLQMKPWEKEVKFDELTEIFKSLTDGQEMYIGFMGGEKALDILDYKALKARQGFKIATKKPVKYADRWILWKRFKDIVSKKNM